MRIARLSQRSPAAHPPKTRATLSANRPAVQNRPYITNPISLMSMALILKRLRIFHQHPTRRLRMKKADHPGQSRPRLLIDQLDTLGLRPLELTLDVLGLETHMRESAATPRDELPPIVISTTRLQHL